MGDADTRLVDLVARLGEHMTARGGRGRLRGTPLLEMVDAWRDAVLDHVVLLWEVSRMDGRWRELSLLGVGVRKGGGGRSREVPAS